MFAHLCKTSARAVPDMPRTGEDGGAVGYEVSVQVKSLFVWTDVLGGFSGALAFYHISFTYYAASLN